MSEEILINTTPQETRVAMLENGVLQELVIERTHQRGLVGNIYMGKVVRVMPGMDASFVNIGLERAAFLHVSDIIRQAAEEAGEAFEPKHTHVAEVLSENQKLLVQVIKEPLGSKGARLTTQITIPSRFLVLMPNMNTVGISSKIESEVERDRLKGLMESISIDYQGHGFIVRTVAETTEVKALKRDAEFLVKLWDSIDAKAKQAEPGELVHEDLPLILRTLRDVAGNSIDKILVDSRDSCQRMRTFANEFVPELKERIEHYSAERPVFDLHSVEEEIKKALDRKVFLKSGGYLIIDQTEAMTTIDVNTGGFIGHRTLEETIYKTNLEAAQTIARQLRLRNLGGIIIIDFIDMAKDEHKQQVYDALLKSLEKDHARTQVCTFSELGLVQMTRKRTRESLEHTLCEACPMCSGRGTVKTLQTVCYEIFREILRVSRQFNAEKLMILAAQDVVDLLLDEESGSLAELEAFIDIPIQFQVESLYTQEQYDVVML